MKHKITTGDPLLTAQLNFTYIIKKSTCYIPGTGGLGFLILLLFKIYSLYPVYLMHMERPTEAYMYVFRGFKSVGWTHFSHDNQF